MRRSLSCGILSSGFDMNLAQGLGRPWLSGCSLHRLASGAGGKGREEPHHLDLYPTGRDNALPMERRIEIVEAKVAELIGLGASVERRTRYDDPKDPSYYVVMHDPEGNEFCVG